MAHLQFNKVRKIFALIKEGISLFRQLDTLLLPIDKLIVRLSWPYALLSGLKTLGGIAFVGLFTKKILDSVGASGHPNPQFVLLVVVGVIVFRVISTGITEYSQYRQSLFVERVEIALQTKMMQKNASLDIARITSPEFFAMHQIAGYGQLAVTRLFKTKNDIISGCCRVLAAFAVVLTVSPVLFLISVVAIVPQIIKIFIFGVRHREQRDKNIEITRQQGEYFHHLVDPRSLTQAKLFKSVPYFISRYTSCFDVLLKRKTDLSKKELKYAIIAGLCQVAAFGVSLAFLANGYLSGSVSIAGVFMFVGSQGVSGDALIDLSRELSEFEWLKNDFVALKKYFDLEPLVKEEQSRPVFFDDVPELRLDGVHFSYPSNPGTEILKGCTFSINKHEKVAIIGDNGAGKSTVLNLLAKVYTVQEGMVTIDSIPISDIAQDSLLSQMICCTQDSGLAILPISESLTASLNPDMTKLKRAASIAGADEFVEELPNGYSTRIGGDWDDGKEFSPGERQRLKLTGSFYRIFDENVRIALFDEPMNHCDVKTRNRFYQLVTNFTDKTVVVVLHDHAYLHYFERVIEIQDGVVVNDMHNAESIRAYQQELLSKKEAEPA